jgi:hypothetical protein
MVCSKLIKIWHALKKTKNSPHTGANKTSTTEIQQGCNQKIYKYVRTHVPVFPNHIYIQSRTFFYGNVRYD